MPKVSKLVGLALILLGIVAYVITGAASITALIPAFFGLVFFGLGYLGDRSESMRKHAMHAALLLAIFGLGGSFGGFMSVFRALGGTPIDNPAAAYAQALMAIICLFFLILGIRSFIEARKAPAKEPTVEEGGESTDH
jgi:hypothetical protein